MDDILKTVKLNNEDYIILDEIQGKAKYVYLIKADDDDVFLIQKEIIEDGESFLVNLESDQEFNEALNLYTKKNA
jgi:hypothetical protein